MARKVPLQVRLMALHVVYVCLPNAGTLRGFETINSVYEYELSPQTPCSLHLRFVLPSITYTTKYGPVLPGS